MGIKEEDIRNQQREQWNMVSEAWITGKKPLIFIDGGCR
jgi:hypothetical protein